MLQSIWQMVLENKAVILAGVYLIGDEIFAFNPKLQNNSIIQFVWNTLKKILPGAQKPQAPQA